MLVYNFLVRWGEKVWEVNHEYYEDIASYYTQLLSPDDVINKSKKQNKTDNQKSSSLICGDGIRATRPGGR